MQVGTGLQSIRRQEGALPAFLGLKIKRETQTLWAEIVT